MIKHLAAGWKMTLWNPALIVIVFLYRFIWGFFLFKFVQSVVIPIMHRFPGEDMPTQIDVFLMEAQFRLMKTDLADPYLRTLLLIIGIRMIATPLINAGVFHNIHQTHIDGKRSFITGIRKWSAAFSIVYWLRMGAVLLPLLWLYPTVRNLLFTGSSWESAIIDLAPLAVGYIVYAGLLKLIAMYVQFGIVSGRGIWPSAGIVLRRIAAVAALSICVLAASVTAAAAGVSLSLMFAGMAAVILHQAHHAVSSLFKLWEIGAQHHLWDSP